MHKANPLSQRLATIPGIGVIIALTFALEIDPAAFKSGRHLAAWIGLTPKEHSTGGKQRLGGISRAGNERLRRLLVTGATAVIRFANRPGNKQANEWLLKLLGRKPRRRGASQQNGPYGVGHDEEWRGVPAPTIRRRCGFRVTQHHH
jgi:transposase